MAQQVARPIPARIVIAAGGTGGHMFPAQALARTLVARGHRVALLTDRRGQGFGPELSEVETYRLSAGAVLGTSPWRKALSLLQLVYGVFQARRLLKRLNAETVVGFGGYASLPAVWAGAGRRLKVVLHEQNAVMGRANRLLARKAGAIATSFQEVQGLAPRDRAKCVVTGNPVRAAVAEIGRRPYAAPGPADRMTLLVTGGSQGARVFNELVPAAVRRLPDELRARLTVVQQVRGTDLDEVRRIYGEAGVQAVLQPFFEDLPQRLAGATLLVCRSGASTVAELAAAGRPALLVPYPFAADDHQRANAEAFATAGGGWVLPQATLDAESLAARLAALLNQPALLAHAAGAARAFARDDAVERLADLVLGRLDGSGDGGGQPGRRKQEAAA